MAQKTVLRQRNVLSFSGDWQAYDDAPLRATNNNEYENCQTETKEFTAPEVQTIIAEHINQRVFFFEEGSENELKNALEKFVAFSIFGKQNVKLKCVDSVVNSIIEKKKKFNQSFTNSVYCSVIYILGTDYTSGKSNIFEVPLFKLYIETDFLELLFIDITGKIYHSWENVLDSDDWFHCLLIAPKNGMYKHSSTTGDIDLEHIVKADCGRGNRSKILIRKDLQEIVNRYFQKPEEKKEGVLDEVLYEITNNLMKKVEFGASLSIDLYKKSEVFVDANIFSKIIEKLGLTWHENVRNDLKEADKGDIEKAKKEAKRELFMLRDDWEWNKKFKEFWIGHKNLFLLYENDWKLVYGFYWDGNIDFEKLIREIFCKKLFKMEILCRNNIYTIQFVDQGHKIKVWADIETDSETGVGYMIVPTTLMRELNPTNMNQGEKLPINNAQENSPLPFNGDIRDFMAKAREFQILVATYCEGQYNHRCLEKFDEEILQIFVGISIFGDKNRAPSPESKIGFTKEELVQINKIVGIIKQKNESFRKCRKEEEKNQIHYGVVQVIGFEYGKDENKFYKTPLFKVFRHKNDENPILIDENGNVFDNWDHFYDANYLPESLICVPRNGSYDLKSENTMDLEFIRTIAYWSKKGRKLKFALHLAICAGSLFFTFYTGPIGAGIALNLATRVGFGLLALDNGYKAYQMYKRTPIFETRIEEYGKSVGMILCVGTDILAGTTGSSLVAHLGLGVLSATGFGLGAYVIFTVTRRAIKNYKETGKIDKNDVLSIVSASLMCGNFAMKLGTAGALILSSEKLQKFPLLRELSSKINNSNNKLTVCVNNLSDVVNRADNFINNYAGLISICSNFTKSALEYANGKKNFSDFKNDCGKFCNDLVKELFHQAWPMLKKYVPKNLANLTDLMYRYIVEKFDVFKIKKWLDEKIQLNTIINNLLKKVLNREKIFEGINATITRVTKKLLKKISIDEEKNIDKIIKTEVFVERAILTNMFQKLQISWNLRQFESIDPNLLKKAFDDSVKDFENRFNESDFIEEFCKYYNDDDHFILLTSRDSCDFYVFQNRTVQSVVKEFNNSCYKMKKEDNIYIITYYYTNQKLVLYFDDSDKSNIVGYVVAENMN